MALIRPVILSGGAGTRLWPLSTPGFPKQFATLTGEDSLFTQALHRLAGRPGVSPPIVVTGSAHAELVKVFAAESGVDIHLVLVEPAGRNTAPASLAAALSSDPDDVLVILPSDHLIRDQGAFADAVIRSVEYAAEGSVVTFGVVPSRAETGYGYIELGEPLPGAYEVRRFKEKPDQEEAERLTSGGNHVWNSGMFVVSAAGLLMEASRHCPVILAGVTAAMRAPVDGIVELGAEFLNVERISLDHAIMEKTENAIVMPIDVGWDDVGSFEALWSIAEKDGRGNVTSGDTVLIDVEGSLVKATSRTVAVAGVSDVVVVETPDVVLVVPRNQSQMVRDLAERAESD
ncbi:MAG: sugar phosphate nucleotidyltransferase [Actinobacteria bacterium]|nr:sugar phosphate nucleotidyltransferase [Actinomycetota bacterium]MCZ6631512.1 sugar phosphate nucleotidyltransferase [Actinomycetota bacterium]MCZ6737780.1 sugar phosphate nucleotidyltransferase [Actinomycetota bacterium]